MLHCSALTKSCLITSAVAHSAGSVNRLVSDPRGLRPGLYAFAGSARTLVTDLVQQLVHRVADALVPLDLSQTELRVGNEPAFCRYLVLNEVVFRPGTANPRPAFPRRVDDVQIVWDQSNEVVDIDVPIA